MGLKDDLQTEVGDIFGGKWTQRDGRVVPDPEDLALGNDAVELEAAVLYADMADSTVLVDKMKPTFAAEVYKSFLVCAARIIRDEGGSITAYDGDRIMGVFIGDSKRSTAARTALKINWAVSNIVNPQLQQFYTTEYRLKHHVGIDVSKIMVARIGVRNDNDLVWVGRAANYAAKLAALDDTAPTFITAAVHDQLSDESKYGGSPKAPMWTERKWTQMNDMKIYSSTWWWPL